MSDNIHLRAGFADAEFTPEPGLALVGQMHERRAKYARDPLMACAAAFSQQDRTVALVAVDMCVLSDVFIDQTQQLFSRQTGLPPRHLLLHSTHTHVAPAESGVLLAPVDEGFRQRLQQAILRAASEAIARMEPVQVYRGAGNMEHMGWNRRGMFADGTSRMYGHSQMPGFVGVEGPRDPTLGVLFARGGGSALRGVIVNFSTHPNCLEGESFYSADIPGEVRRILRQLLGPQVVVVYITGAAGNTAPSILDPYSSPQPWRGEAGLIRSGLYLAGEAAKVIASTLTPMADPVLRLEQTSVPIPRRPYPAAGHRNRYNGGWSRLADDYYARAETDWPARSRSPLDVRLNALRIGDAAICTNPAELFVEFGLAIRDASPAKLTMIAELTDGDAGYVPTPLAFSRGGYETWAAPSSQLAEDAGDQIVSQTRQMLRQAWKYT